ERNIRKAEKAVKIAEEKIADLELRQTSLEGKLSQGDASPDIIDEYSKVSTALEAAMSEWEAAQLALEDVQSQSSM
ncbi:MAG: ABC transporter ATP-binding protein, partial [Muribaculaceae bacterium]|nr:ABC transporter ATP-binding protein [Muribaculaceae bacterium]